jgi:hypothetical protein
MQHGTAASLQREQLNVAIGGVDGRQWCKVGAETAALGAAAYVDTVRILG